MKTMIYQVKVGKPPAFYDVCIDSVERYCQKYGIDHVVQTEPKLKIRPVKSARSKMAVERLGYIPHYEKANAFNYLDEYDIVGIIDSDIYIRDISPNIFEEMEKDTIFAGVREYDMPLNSTLSGKVKKYSHEQYGSLKVMPKTNKGIPFYNTGVILLSKNMKQYFNGESPEEFIKRKDFEGFVNGEGHWRWAADQTMLNYWIQKTGMKTQNLDWKWNTLFNGVKDNLLPNGYFIHFFLSGKLRNIPKIIKDYDARSWKK